VPKIEDNGNIRGCYLLINILAGHCGVYKITNSEEVLQKEVPLLFHKLKERLNQYIFLRISRYKKQFEG